MVGRGGKWLVGIDLLGRLFERVAYLHEVGGAEVLVETLVDTHEIATLHLLALIPPLTALSTLLIPLTLLALVPLLPLIPLTLLPLIPLALLSRLPLVPLALLTLIPCALATLSS